MYQQVAGLIILKAQIVGYQTVFLVASGLLFAGAVLAFLFINVENVRKGAEVLVE